MASQDSIRVFKRSRSPYWQLEYRDEDGKKHYKSTGETQRRKADKAAGAWAAEIIAQGIHAASSRGRLGWGQFRNRYEDEVLSGLADTTAKKVWSVFNTLERIIDPQTIGSITTRRLSEYQMTLRDEGRSESTIRGHLAHLRSALQWGCDQGLIVSVPKIPKTQRAKNAETMKGRPITTEEFERMITAVPKVIVKPNLGKSKKKPPTDEARVPSWKRLLYGLWLSGLRLEEALALRWDQPGELVVDMSAREPVIRIAAEGQKSHKEETLVVAPEFADFLKATPKADRRGYVFNPKPQRQRGERLSTQQAGKNIQAIGKAAKVVVDRDHTENPKYASAHDLRRTFGTRWAERVMPQRLMKMMRHANISTTLKFYVAMEAQREAAALREVVASNGGTLEALDIPASDHHEQESEKARVLRAK